MTHETIPCKRCKCMPEVVEVSGLYYVQCHGTYKKRVNEKNLTKEEKVKKPARYITVACDKWGPYEFLGISRNSAILSWNEANSKNTLDEEE